MFALLIFGDKGVRVLAGLLLKSKILEIGGNWIYITFILWSLKCDQPCVNSPSYFQQWNRTTNLSIDSKYEIFNLGFRLDFQFFPNSQRDWKLGFLNVALAGLLSFFEFIKDIYIAIFASWPFAIRIIGSCRNGVLKIMAKTMRGFFILAKLQAGCF